jgi:hypothetical protein
VKGEDHGSFDKDGVIVKDVSHQSTAEIVRGSGLRGGAACPFLTPILAVLILLTANNLYAQLHRAFTGKVFAIADGDTLTVLDENRNCMATEHESREATHLFGADSEPVSALGIQTREPRMSEARMTA